MQEGGAAARQAGDEDRPLDRLVQNGRIAQLRVAEPQQVGEEPHDVPACGHAADQAERRLLVAAGPDSRRSGSTNDMSPKSCRPLRRWASAMRASASIGRRNSPTASAKPSAIFRTEL